VEGEGDETGDKRESALRDCWWVITPASGRERHLWEQKRLWFGRFYGLSRGAFGARGAPSVQRLSVWAPQGEFACHSYGSSWLTEKNLQGGSGFIEGTSAMWIFDVDIEKLRAEVVCTCVEDQNCALWARKTTNRAFETNNQTSF
jgi:hypothetical protein